MPAPAEWAQRYSPQTRGGGKGRLATYVARQTPGRAVALASRCDCPSPRAEGTGQIDAGIDYDARGGCRLCGRPCQEVR